MIFKQSAWDIGQMVSASLILAMGHTIVPFCKKSHLSISEYVNKNLMTCLYFDFFFVVKMVQYSNGIFSKMGQVLCSH